MKTTIRLPAEVSIEYSHLINAWLIRYYLPCGVLEDRIAEAEIIGYRDIPEKEQARIALKISKKKLMRHEEDED